VEVIAEVVVSIVISDVDVPMVVVTNDTGVVVVVVVAEVVVFVVAVVVVFGAGVVVVVVVVGELSHPHRDELFFRLTCSPFLIHLLS